ncbi:MAG: hypothetical protein ACYC6G_15550 [Desulfobaccales bacterium]
MLKIVMACIMVLFLSTVVYAKGEADPGKETSSATTAKTEPKEDDCLAIYKKGWQIFIAPYVWVPGTNMSFSKQGSQFGTTKINIPWYDIVPKLFSSVFGAMGRVEVWNGKWGFFVDNIFMYTGETASGTGHKQIRLNKLPVPLDLTLSGQAKVIVRQGSLDVGGRYLVATIPFSADKQTPVLSAELLGGLRYAWYNQFTGLGFNADLSGPAGRVLLTRGGSLGNSFKLSVVGPFLGVRTGLWLTQKFNLLVKAEVGEFGIVGDDYVDCVLEGLAGYQIQKHIRVYAGYRAHYFTFNQGSGLNSVSSRGWLQGPLVGAVFNF